EKYVKYYTAEMTKKPMITAVIDPDTKFAPNSATAQGIRNAAARLMEPIQTAKKANNTAFLTAYTRLLAVEVPKLLQNHLIARLEGMIVLAQTGQPDAQDIFIKQLGDKDQTVWVKLWAARGLTNIVQTPTGGLGELQGGAPSMLKAARALMAFLDQEDLPWPAPIRALEALGSLRRPPHPSAPQRGEMAPVALRRLPAPGPPPRAPGPA